MLISELAASIETTAGEAKEMHKLNVLVARFNKLVTRRDVPDPGRAALAVLWCGKDEKSRQVAAVWLNRNGFGGFPTDLKN